VAFVLDLRQIMLGKVEGFGRIDRRGSHVIAMVAIKLTHVGLWIAAPVALGAPVLVVLAGYLVFACTVSIAFTAVLVGTHLVDGVRLTARGDLTGRAAWVDRQLRSSVSIAPESRLARWFFGGIHTHAAHHLFPGVSHGRIDPLRRIVEQMAERHGIALIETTALGVLAGHWRYLRAMGRRPSGAGSRACEPKGTDGALRSRAVVADARVRCAESIRELRAVTERLRAGTSSRPEAYHRHYFFAMLLQVSLERLSEYAPLSGDPWLLYTVIDGAYRAHRKNVLDHLDTNDPATPSPDWSPYLRRLARRTGPVTLLDLRKLLGMAIRAHHEADLSEALKDAIARIEGQPGDVRTAFLTGEITPVLASVVGDYLRGMAPLIALPVPMAMRVLLLRVAWWVGGLPSIAQIQCMRREVFDATFGRRFQ
jgi:hypothetical protein